MESTVSTVSLLPSFHYTHNHLNAFMNAYEEKQEAKRERLRARAERKMTTGQNLIHRAHSELGQIPFGQPILVGHHSERPMRNMIARNHARIDRGFEEINRAREFDRRADAVGTGGVSQDDPNAIAKLKVKLAEFQAEKTRWQAIIKAMRASVKHPGALDLLNLTEGELRTIEHCPWYAQRLSPNFNANIRRVEKRIAELEAKSQEIGRPDKVESWGKLTENKEINRLQFIFPGKPSDTIISMLKASGFRWSPSEKAWQSFLNNRSRHKADAIIKHL